MSWRIVGIGTDIIECLRIAQMIERHGELFINRIYTAQEIRFCQTRKHATQHFAARWAAKEAVLKALGSTWRKGIQWRDIEILPREQGGDEVRLHRGARELAQSLGVSQFQLSLAHCRSHAVAYVLAAGSGAALVRS